MKNEYRKVLFPKNTLLTKFDGGKHPVGSGCLVYKPAETAQVGAFFKTQNIRRREDFDVLDTFVR